MALQPKIILLQISHGYLAVMLAFIVKVSVLAELQKSTNTSVYYYWDL
jgi:hypothetical protein